MNEGSNPTGEADDPVENAMPFWDQVVADMEATAEEYRERGWTAIELHPGDITTLAGDLDRTGFDLLAPDNEFEEIADAVDAADGFDDAEVFRADASGTIFFVVALESADTETAVLLPGYYSPGEAEEFVQMVARESEVRVHVRPLDKRRILTFTHNDTSLFLPTED